MDFYALSLPEAAYLYAGLAVQALIRGVCRFLPAVLVTVMTLRLLGQGGLTADRRTLGRVVGYVATSALILVLFWPEAVGRLGGVSGQLEARRVGSWAAANDPDAAIVTAQDTGLIPRSLLGPQVLPTGFSLLLRAFTETHLALAQALHAQTHRPFASVLPMQWLLTQQLAGDAQAAVADWVHGCYLPAQARVLAQGGDATYQALLPWGGSRLAAELPQLTTTPGQQVGVVGMVLEFLFPGAGSLVTPATTPLRCDQYLQMVEQRVQTWLGTQTTSRGTPLPQVFQQELGLAVSEQSHFLLYREMLRAAGPAIPAPSLTGTYLTLRGFALLGGVLSGGGQGAVKESQSLTMRGLGTTPGAKIGVATSALATVNNELQRALDGASSLVGLATFLTWWSPYILGLVNLVLLGLFPIVLLWALVPHSQGQPLALYFAALFFTTATPLWWALIDLAARLTGPVVASNLVAFPVEWFNVQLMTKGITALGLLVVPLVTGIMIFGSFRSIGRLWRGGA